MADKLIGSLPETTSIASNDLLVTEQTSIAKKITADNLLSSLSALWTEHGGIESFDLVSTSGLSKTYRMTYADESYTDITITDGTGITDIVTTTSGLTHTITISLNDGTTKVFTVDDGVGISSISAPSTVGLEDTYTINLSDGSTSTFTVTNGASVSSITLNGTTITFAKDDGNTIDLPVPTLRIRYSVTQPDDNNDIITTPSNWMGVAWALDSAVLHYTDYAWFKIKGETGDNAEVSTYTRQYKYDTDGTQPPTTGYYSTIAAAQSAVGGAIQGKYLWIATTVTWNNGTPTVIYSASYQGLDGTGLSGVVKSIYMADTGISLSPDSNGQVTISDADIGSIADPATKSDGQVLTWDATDQVWYAGSVATGTVNSVNSQLPDVGGNVTIYGTNVAMSSTNSTTVKAAIDAKPDDLSDLGVTASATELNYIVGVTSNIQDQLDAMAKAVSYTASGAIASFTAEADNMPVTSLVANIEPKQSGSGDPSPSNVRTISGWTGCNVARAGKNLSAVNTIENIGWASSRPDMLTFMNSLPSGTYRISFKSTLLSIDAGKESQTWNTGFTFMNTGGSIFAQRETSAPVQVGDIATYSGSLIIAPTKKGKFTAVYAYGAGNYSVGAIGRATLSEIQIELGSTATAYEPYQGTTVAVDWTTEAGTVYGGTIDVTTGLLTVDRAMVDLGTLNYTYIDNFKVFVGSLSGVKIVGAARVPNMISSMYNAVSWTVGATDATKDGIVCALPEYNQVRLRNLGYTDPSTFKSAMKGVPLVYELATPQTYQLTPQEVKTLLGTNNVWADTGDTTVRYIDVDSDLSDYFVEKATYKSGQLLQDRNLAYVESSIRASRAYSVNNYFINADGVLCRITASVSSGGTLIKGTNYIVVTGGLANDLYSLLS